MPETSASTSAGLFTRDEGRVAVPLTGVSVEAEICGLGARVAVAHHYVNREATPIEAVYVFPLDEGAAVCGFEAVIDGTLVVGEVHEREKAFEIYDDAMEAGHGAFLLDEERSDVFQASVGNLPPGKEALVRLTYVTELPVESGRVRFTIPTTVSPRYAPAEDCSGVGRSDAETLNPPVAWSVPYGLDLSVRIAMPGRITALESPSHPVSVTMNECDATVTLGQTQTALDRDFVLSIDAAGMDTAQAFIERDDEGTESIAVAFVPRFADTSAPAEVIFVVDRSGSMAGTSIEEVRNALQLCLRSLVAGCRFNIVGFGSTHESLFPEARAYEQASLDAASRHVESLRADLGGTEILPALQFALEQPRAADLPRQLIVLTDGQVTNTDAVLALAAKHAATTRIFALGIGAGASQHLVRGLARVGRGSAEFIYPSERIEPKVLRVLGRVLSPALADVSLEWIGGEVTQAPRALPPVFAGGRVLAYGAVKDARPTSARLSASGPSGPLSFEIPFDAIRVMSGRIIAPLAARARIRELEESGDWLAARGSRQVGRRNNRVAQEIIDLSVRHGLMSRETSFVAVERRETPVVGDIQLRRVPIALTTGWGALDHRRQPAAGATRMLASIAYASSPRSLEDATTGLSAPLRALGVDRWTDAVRDTAASIRGQFKGRAEPARTPPGLQSLVALQGADGAWDLTVELAAALGRTLRELEAAIAGVSGSPSEVRRAWATALALAWVELRAMGVEEQWRLLARKAQKWLDQRSAAPPGGGTWNAMARDFLSP
jgi:hypothetical protein